MSRRDQDVVRMTKLLAHPEDRRVRQLERKQARFNRADNQATKRKQDKERMLARTIWFREQCIALGYTKEAVPAELVVPLVRLFIGRNAAEIAELKQMRNPPLGRIRLLEHMTLDEVTALRSGKGFEIPVLESADEVEILTEMWDLLPETAVVLERTTVSTGGRTEPTEAERAVMRELQSRLRPIAEVRADAEAVLPTRVHKFGAQGRALLVKKPNAPKADGDEAARRKLLQKQSAKHLGAASGEAMKQRVRETAQRKQQANLKKQRRAVLGARRNEEGEEAEDD